MYAHNRTQRGFALFEVMITVFLLAVGVLGLAAVQMKTYSITRDSDYRTNVALHAEGLAEAVRQLFELPQDAQKMAQAGLKVMQGNQGALKRLLDGLDRLINR